MREEKVPVSVRARRTAGVLTAVALLLASCSSGEGGDTTTPPPPPPGSTTTQTTRVATTLAPADTTTNSEQTTTTIEDEAVRLTFVIEDGSVNGIDRFAVSLGAVVVLTIKSDAADEVHLHGYDVMIDLEPGVPAELAFTADIPGIFEMELETARILITELQVNP